MDKPKYDQLATTDRSNEDLSQSVESSAPTQASGNSILQAHIQRRRERDGALNATPATQENVAINEPVDENLTIKFKLISGSERQCEIKSSELSTMTIADLKLRGFRKEIEEDGSLVRLVFSGKMLADHTLVSSYNFKQNQNIHAVITRQQNNVNPSMQQQPPAQINLRQEILDEIRLNMEGSHLSSQERQSMREYRALIERSSDQEIEAQRDYLSTIRTIRQLAEQDQRQQNQYAMDDEEAGNPPPRNEQVNAGLQRLREARGDRNDRRSSRHFFRPDLLGNQSEDPSGAGRSSAEAVQGTYGEMLFGCLLGWILGIFAICCLFGAFGRRRPTKRFRNGIYVGILLKLLIAMSMSQQNLAQRQQMMNNHNSDPFSNQFNNQHTQSHSSFGHNQDRDRENTFGQLHEQTSQREQNHFREYTNTFNQQHETKTVETPKKAEPVETDVFGFPIHHDKKGGN